MASFYNELKRRNVVRVGVAYVVVAWLLIQAAGILEPALLLPDWVDRVTTVFLLIGFPVALIFAWAFEMTPEGIRLEKEVDRGRSIAAQTGRKLDFIIIAVLVVAVTFLGVRQFVLSGSEVTAVVDDPRPSSIAVLPFEDYSEAQDQGYFSKGIAEEILNLLAKTKALRVAARTSSFAFANSEMDIREIGNKLDVSTVLEGSIRKSGDNIRITTQLINVEDGYHLWSETYDRNYSDIFRIQDEIAASIIASLKVRLLGEEEQLMVSERSVDVDAYSAYLIGNERMALRTREDIEAARSQYEKAIKIDPQFAPAHVQLVHAWLLLEQEIYGGKESDITEVDAVIKPHLRQALALAPASPEAIGVQGYYHLRRYQYAAARNALDRAIALNPNYALAYDWRADTAYEQERFLDMLADREKAYALDPMSLQISADLAGEYRNFWRPRDAERVINRMFDLHPDHPLAYLAAIENLASHGRKGESQLMLDKALAANPDHELLKSMRLAGSGSIYYFG